MIDCIAISLYPLRFGCREEAKQFHTQAIFMALKAWSSIAILQFILHPLTQDFQSAFGLWLFLLHAAMFRLPTTSTTSTTSTTPTATTSLPVLPILSALLVCWRGPNFRRTSP